MISVGEAARFLFVKRMGRLQRFRQLFFQTKAMLWLPWQGPGFCCFENKARAEIYIEIELPEQTFHFKHNEIIHRY
jgi:hypothetical protein